MNVNSDHRDRLICKFRHGQVVRAYTQHIRLLDKRYMPDDQDVAIKNDGETSEHIETFGRLGAYEEGAGKVAGAEVRVPTQKPHKDPKKEEKKEKKPQTSLFDF